MTAAGTTAVRAATEADARAIRDLIGGAARLGAAGRACPASAAAYRRD